MYSVVRLSSASVQGAQSRDRRVSEHLGGQECPGPSWACCLSGDGGHFLVGYRCLFSKLFGPGFVIIASVEKEKGTARHWDKKPSRKC